MIKLKDKLRKEIMYNSIIGFGKDTNKLKLNNKLYLIDNRLKNKIRLKNTVLIVGMFILTFIYNISNDKNFGMKAADASNSDFINGIMLTIIFLGSVVLMAYLLPRLVIPSDLSEFKMLEIEDNK